MNSPNVLPLINGVDATLSRFLGDGDKDNDKKRDARRHRDNINKLLTELGDEQKRVLERLNSDYETKIQREINEINRIIQS